MTERLLRLRDGRTLAWREFGDLESVALVAVHGSPDSSSVWGLLDDAAQRVGVRVVAPDRPGFGASTPKPGRLIGMRPPADREIIRRPEVLAVLRENLPNQFKDPESMALEMANAARPWGFDLDAITVPTTIWQGGLDDVHTPAMGRHLAEHIPNADSVFEPDYATFNFIDDFDTILATLVAAAP